MDNWPKVKLDGFKKRVVWQIVYDDIDTVTLAILDFEPNDSDLESMGILNSDAYIVESVSYSKESKE